jgi:hypothetical protein
MDGLPQLDPWRPRFGYLLVAALILGPLLWLLGEVSGKAEHCERYWTPERKVEQLWSAYLLDLERTDGTLVGTPEPAMSRADINQMFVMMRTCAGENGIDECMSELFVRRVAERVTSSGMKFSWTIDKRWHYAEHININVKTQSGEDRSRNFYLPGCNFHSSIWRMAK